MGGQTPCIFPVACLIFQIVRKICLQVGPTDAPPVLMCHGWLDNCYSFVPLLTKLPQNRRYIALDLPGHGHSTHKHMSCYEFSLSKPIVSLFLITHCLFTWNCSKFQFRLLCKHIQNLRRLIWNYNQIWFEFPGRVADLEHIRKSLDLEKLTFIGHSMSGILAILYSATYPERIEKTVVLDSLFPFVKGPSEVLRLFLRIYLHELESMLKTCVWACIFRYFKLSSIYWVHENLIGYCCLIFPALTTL